MTQVVSSISGLEIYSPSAGFAPTNSGDVSAIASAYQVVSSTATQLYAGTAFLTEVNSATVSASRAGQAANASLANSAYYDGTGRLISALPDSAAVSAIASAYQVVSSTASGSGEIFGQTSYYATEINGLTLSAQEASLAAYATNAGSAAAAPTNSAEVSAIASSYAESAVSSKQDSSAMSAYALSSNVSGVIDTVSSNSATWGAGATLPIIGSAGTDSATYGETSVEFNRYDTAGEPDIRTATLSPDALDITYTVDESNYYSVHINENGVEFSDPDGYYSVTPYDITNWNSAVETVANNSATWGQGGVDSATVSSIASSYAESAASSKLDTTAQVVSATAGDGTYITSINGMGLSGQGGGGGGGVVTATAGSASYVTSINNSAIAVKHIMQNATQLAGSIGFFYMPTASPFGQPTGVLSPLQYATGACLAMVNGSFNAYYKGNELFVTNTSYGVVRMEVHQSRGEHVYGSSMNSATGFHIHGSGTDGQLGTAKKWRIGASGISGQSSTSTPWQYGYAEYDQLTSVHDTVSANSASWGGGGGASLPITGSAGDDSASYEAGRLEFTRYDTAGEPDIRTASLSPDSLWMDYTLDGNDHTSMTLNESMLDFGDSDGDHIVDAYSIDTWNSAVDTVANNSASWGQGGVDSATVSAIASSYAESAVSSKADSSSLSSYALSSEVSGVIDTVSANSASWAGGATGDYVETSATLVTIGSNVSANGTSFVQGDQNTATYFSLVQGLDNSGNNNNTLLQGYKNRGSSTNVFAQGTNNSAFGCSFAQGNVNKAEQTSVAQGDHCSASSNSFSQGYNNSASVQSFAQGYANSAYNRSFAQGLGVVVKNTAAAFGTYNLSSDGDTSTGNSAAFAIGDGTAANARHNLMLVTKDGEITMYSSTADTVGTGIMSSIRAISAAATGASVSLPITGTSGDDTASYEAGRLEFTRYDPDSGPEIRTASLSPRELQFLYTNDEQDYTVMELTDSMLQFRDQDGAHIVDAYSIGTWNSVLDTVAFNSASWGGGGAQVVTATGSALATAGTPFFPITTYLVSSINGSALLPYGYSALSGNSANWNSTRNVVTANSANWNSAYSLISGVTALMDAI